MGDAIHACILVDEEMAAVAQELFADEGMVDRAKLF